MYLVVPRVVVVTRRCFAWDLFLVVLRVDFDPAGASRGTLGPWRSLGWLQRPAGASLGVAARIPLWCCVVTRKRIFPRSPHMSGVTEERGVGKHRVAATMQQR